jgi:hypothetical protein
VGEVGRRGEAGADPRRRFKWNLISNFKEFGELASL